MAATCANCKLPISFGSVKHGRLRFCSRRCRDEGAIAMTKGVPEAMIAESVRQVWAGPCPLCKGSGPVDIHRHYTVFSAVILTRWTTQTRTCCRKCAARDQLMALGKAVVLGWWGFPWGLFVTPVQIVRNVVGLVRPPDPAKPSRELENGVRFKIAENIRLSQKWDKPAGAAA